MGLRAQPARRSRVRGCEPVGSAIDGAIEVDRERCTARVPAGARIDLGGIAKSWMAVRAADVVCDACDDSAVLVDAGGDLIAARGVHIVGVEAPLSPHSPAVASIELSCGQGVATSGFGRRRWRNGDGRTAHHLIDPSTGAPGPFAHATVVADDPVAADVLATTLALRPQLIAAMAEAAMVIVEGRVRTTERWQQVVAR